MAEMAEFTIRGLRDRPARRVSVTWRSGVVTSSDEDVTARWITELARGLDGTPQGLPGLPTTLHNHLSNPYSACAIIRSVFSGAIEQDRPLPQLAPLPPGAIA